MLSKILSESQIRSELCEVMDYASEREIRSMLHSLYVHTFANLRNVCSNERLSSAGAVLKRSLQLRTVWSRLPIGAPFHPSLHPFTRSSVHTPTNRLNQSPTQLIHQRLSLTVIGFREALEEIFACSCVRAGPGCR